MGVDSHASRAAQVAQQLHEDKYVCFRVDMRILVMCDVSDIKERDRITLELSNVHERKHLQRRVIAPSITSSMY